MPAIAALLVAGSLGWRMTRSTDRSRVKTAAARPAPTETSTTAVEAPTTSAVEPETTTTIAAAPEVADAPLRSDPGGSRLRVGTAHPVGSPAVIADAVGRTLGLYSQPGQAEPDEVAKNPTREGLPVVGLVMQQRGDWIEMQISRRPNEATAWVRAAEVRLRTTPYHIRVDSASHRLIAYSGSTPVLDAPVAVGTGGTPTPRGSFFIDGEVKLANPNGPYGAYQLSVAAFSEVLHSFAGGVGQIAIHGTNAPGLVGAAVSHGCVRMTNDDIARLASFAPVGTPVEIY